MYRAAEIRLSQIWTLTVLTGVAVAVPCQLPVRTGNK